MRLPLSTLLFFLVQSLFAQHESIQFELNGRNPEDLSKNPFANFVGEWTLKNDKWTQNWGGETETIDIPGHHTINKQLNTSNSLLSIIDGPEPNGHIFWSINPNTKVVDHLSSFGDIRVGVGQGSINDKGDVQLKIRFEGEPKDTYRIYNYVWINTDEYHMKSVQYNDDNKPTGLFYEGNFIRIKNDKDLIIETGNEIRRGFLEANMELIKSLHHPKVIKALGYNNVQEGIEEVLRGIQETLSSYSLEFIKNDIESILVQGNTAIEQTVFSIKGTPKNGGDPFIFSGRTMVTYIKYHKSPTGWASIREIIQMEE